MRVTRVLVTVMAVAGSDRARRDVHGSARNRFLGLAYGKGGRSRASGRKSRPEVRSAALGWVNGFPRTNRTGKGPRTAVETEVTAGGGSHYRRKRPD